MNIGLVLGTFPPDHVGGTEVQAAELAKRLGRRHQVVVLTRRTGTGSTSSDSIEGARVFRHPVPEGSRARSLRAFLAKRRTITSIQPRPQVLVCYHLADAGFIGRLLSLACGIPYVLWLRSEYDLTYLRSFRGRMLARSVLGGAAAIFAQTEGLARTWREALRARGLGRLEARLRGRLSVYGNAIDPLPEFRAGRKTARASGRVLFAGRLLEDKGLFELLEAVRSLPGARLIVAGEGRDRPRLERAAAGVAVEFLGLIGRQALFEEMARATVLCLPSWHEGMPNVILEAQAAALPVVATRVGAIPELIVDGESGLLVPPRDPRALARALRRLLEDDSLRGRLAGGGLSSCARFGWDKMIPRLEEKLEHLIENSQRMHRHDAP